MRLRVRGHIERSLIAVGLAWFTGLCPGPARAQGVSVAFTPHSQTVAPGAEFTVDVEVTRAGSAFNTIDCVVTFDPAALTYLPTSPAKLQEGCLMNGLCSAACGNTFHYSTSGADSMWVVDGLLCADTYVTGPGQLYHLRFRASNTPRVTAIRFRSFAAYAAGINVTPVSTTDAVVGIGVTLDANATPSIAGGPLVRATPNPSHGSLLLSVESDRAGEQELEVHDLLGRLVRALPRGWQPAGSARVAWDGRDASGARVPPGVYLVTLRAGQRSARSRVVLIE
jgi:hypothetical protein